jgi:geranylgeranyl reductase family protein
VTDEHYPFAIVGAGPAGATCANALLLGGAARVALIDRSRFPRDKICGDGIGPGVIAILDALDMQNVLSGHDRVSYMAITSPLGGRMSLDAAQIKRRSPLGYVIRRVTFDHALLTAALDRGATDMTGWGLEAATYENGRWRLTTAESDTGETRTITADVLIGADGASSRVRRLLGQRFNRDKHTCIAIRVLAKTDPPLPALQRLDVVDGIPIPGYGWLFSTGRGVVNIGVATDIPTYKADARHLKQILKTYEDFLGGAFAYDPQSCRTQILPLASQMPRLAFPQVHAALIGDAASMINPVTGEGIFYGMEAGLRLGGKLANAQKSGAFAAALVDYEREFLRTFKPHLRGNFYLRKLLGKPVLLERMVNACARNSELSCDYLEYMMGNESGIGTKPLYRLGLDTVLA